MRLSVDGKTEIKMERALLTDQSGHFLNIMIIGDDHETNSRILNILRSINEGVGVSTNCRVIKISDGLELPVIDALRKGGLAVEQLS